MRQAVYAPQGVVATSQPLAAQAGLAMLREGGSAVDAAVAAAVTLTQVQPGSNDIGGDRRVDRRAAFAQHGQACLGRERLTRGHHSLGRVHRLSHS